jgi:RP/EB family microtubule-associated protein
LIVDVEKRQQTLPFCDQLPTGGNTGNTGGFTSTGSGSMSSNRREMLIAHGVLASLAFVVFFPLGAIAIRLGSFTGLVWIHGAFQVFAYTVYIAAFGLGVYIACGLGRLSHYHPIIGMVVFAVLFFQPVLGFMHHLMFKKHNGRTLWSHAHIWLGRTAIPLGIINGGLGMKLAESTNMSSKAGKIAYGVVAGVMGLAWLAAIIIGEKRRSATASPKYAHSQGSSGVETSEVPPTNGHSAPK